MLIFVAVLTLVTLVTAEPPCEDLNTAACALFLSSKPDLCQDAALSANCKRFCGLCPLVCYDCPAAVNSSDACNSTKACALGEVCMQKTHTVPGNTIEFILSCEAKETCEGLSLGFHTIVGKRDLTFHCCDTDKCNYPTEFITTTTQVPPTTPSTTFPTTLQPLNNCSRDIVFVLDGSTSVGSMNHNLMKSFIQRVISGITIGPLDSLVAVVEYSNTARVEWYLTDHMTSSDLSQAAANIPYVQGTTGTHAALYLVHESVLTSNHGARPNAKDVVILLTDGGTDSPDLAVSEAKTLAADGATLIAIGVGPNVQTSELTKFVTQDQEANSSDLDQTSRMCWLIWIYTAHTRYENRMEQRIVGVVSIESAQKIKHKTQCKTQMVKDTSVFGTKL